ncbi:MAG: Rrf2 family transcriptional regulator [Bacteroidetes bacterium]|nr:MAG: Rrf2 family transcriptional regulator [Bacteroidota bacterium]
MTMTLMIEYAVRMLMAMGTAEPGAIFNIRAIAQLYGIPEKYLRKIVPLLTKQGILLSKKGNRGGIALARPADSISLLDIIMAVDGDIFLNRCTFSETFCHRTPWCAVHSVWVEAQEHLKSFLAKKSIRHLAAQTAYNKLHHTA